MTFDTTSVPAKHWFYPRYTDGSPHEPVVSAALIQHLADDTAFIDVGAHVGYYTVLAATVASSGMIHAFELDPRLVPVVDAHLVSRSNGGVEPVRVVCGAVGDNVGSVSAFTPVQSGNLSTNTVVEDGDEWASSIAAPMTTLDHYCSRAELSPEVVKIDVEGYEAHVVDGATNVLTSVDALLLEVRPEGLERVGRSVVNLLADLDGFGFAIQRFSDHRASAKIDDALTTVEDPASLTENTMLLCTQ